MAVPTSTSLRFRCASCGKDYSVDPSKLPATGGRGPCKNCGEAIAIHRDGRLEGAIALAPAQNPDHESWGGPWEVFRHGQALGPFTLLQMKDLVAAGTLAPEQPVRKPGGAWSPAGTCLALAPLFTRAEPPPGPPESSEAPEDLGSEGRCAAHPGSEPDYHCNQCLRYLCANCVRDAQFGGRVRPVKVCSHCGALATPLVRRERWTPFYSDLGHVFVSPLKGHALFYFICLAVAELLKIPAAFGYVFGLMAVGILAVFQWSFYLHLIKAVGNGSYDFPDWPEMDDIGSMVGSVLKVLFVTILSLLPMIAAAILMGAGASGFLLALAAGGAKGAAGGAALGGTLIFFLLMGVFYILYLPICIVIVAVHNTVLPALNPVLIFRVILRLGGPYLAAVALLVALNIIEAFLAMALSGIPLLGPAVSGVAGVYFTLVSCYILGRMAYENGEKLGW